MIANESATAGGTLKAEDGTTTFMSSLPGKCHRHWPAVWNRRCDLCGDVDAERGPGEKRRPWTIRLDDAEDAKLEAEDVDQHQADHEVGHRQKQRREAAQDALAMTALG